MFLQATFLFSLKEVDVYNSGIADDFCMELHENNHTHLITVLEVFLSRFKNMF